MGKIRDSQKHKVYAADARFWKQANLKKRTLRELQKKAAQLLHGPTFNKYSTDRYPVTVRLASSASNHSWTEHNALIIAVNEQQMNFIVVAHEMAHILIMREFGYRVSSHGQEYAWIYRGLAEEVLTKANFSMWEKSQLKSGVRWNSESVLF